MLPFAGRLYLDVLLLVELTWIRGSGWWNFLANVDRHSLPYAPRHPFLMTQWFNLGYINERYYY